MRELRRQSGKSRNSKNAIGSLLNDTTHEGSGVIVEEIEALGLNKDPPVLKKDQEESLIQSEIKKPIVTQTNYQIELASLIAENELLKAQKSPLSKNEEKLLNAIRSEKLNQSVELPIMSRAIFKSLYGMNEKYIGKAIEGLLSKELVARHSAKKNGQNTFSWEIL